MTKLERLIFGLFYCLAAGMIVGGVMSVSYGGNFIVGAFWGALVGAGCFLWFLPEGIANFKNIPKPSVSRASGIDGAGLTGGLFLLGFYPEYRGWAYVIWVGAGLFWFFRLTLAVEGSSGKQCPDCAETVKSEALKCKHCGYRFEQS